LANWIYEDGIGEERAILVGRGRIIEARIEPRGLVKAGLVANAQFVKQLVAGKRGIARLDGGAELMLSPLPAGLTEGASLVVEVTRAAIDERSRFKLPLARAVLQKALQPAPKLIERIGDARICHAHQPDRFAEYGWNEVIEEARSGHVGFAGGSLLISVTPAMTLIDIDGELPAKDLAHSAANSAAEAIRRLDIQGMIGIDFPNVVDKAERQAVAETFDSAMTGPFERTAINGFGFLQLVKRRTGPSLPEMMQYRRSRSYAMELLRFAERDNRPGPLNLAAHPATIKQLEARVDLLAELTKRTGRTVSLRADPKLSTGGYYAG
jgi:Ribonuclease G/E